MSIAEAPNVLTKPVSNVNRTDKLKMCIFRYISDEFGVLKKLIKYVLEIYIVVKKIELRDALWIVFSHFDNIPGSFRFFKISIF